ncbi:hypothetical protein D9599_07775 [Roseomonas sp. KE2513]|uniref:hypothetical protein n=1 Tax=Roseomonas sp. KE2513 TaxID=2479202 RepID=UPI0018DF745E|nr:hypothetical protein [Roseomonas sp. KE2513]MBI0535466.1 hypothetical protein [Roseomonas sp. KE2513]
MKQHLSSLTTVIVVNGKVPEPRRYEQLASVLEAARIDDFDVVLVANGVDAAVTLDLKEFVSQVPDSTAVFLNRPQTGDVARLVGIDHAVGDYILFTALSEEEILALPDLLEPLREGYDLSVADPLEGPLVVQRPAGTRFLLGTYLSVYQLLTGKELESRPTGFRAMSRAAALFVSANPTAEITLRARDLGPGFACITRPLLPGHAFVHRPGSLRSNWSSGISALLSTTSAPMRLVTYFAAAGGVLSLGYGAYVIGVYFFGRNIARGWTTISLQLAAMMFIFSVLFLLLSEYVLQIHAANPPRSLRHLVLRELRSPLSRRSARLNVVDAEGRFQVGAPPELLTNVTKTSA